MRHSRSPFQVAQTSAINHLPIPNVRSDSDFGTLLPRSNEHLIIGIRIQHFGDSRAESRRRT